MVSALRLVDYEEKVFEDVKSSKPGEKALVTFHTVAFEGSIGFVNLLLGVFKLLPIPPLDGRTFLEYLPRSLSSLRDLLFRYGGFVFLALVLFPPVGGRSPIGWLILPFQLLIVKYLHLLHLLAT